MYLALTKTTTIIASTKNIKYLYKPGKPCSIIDTIVFVIPQHKIIKDKYADFSLPKSFLNVSTKEQINPTASKIDNDKTI